MNLLADLLTGAERHAARTALVDAKGRTFSYGELVEASAALAAAWSARGVGEGDRVLVCMKVGFGLYAGLIALWRLGTVAIFPEPALGLFGLRHAAATTAPKAYLAEGWYRWLKPLLRDLRRIPMTLPATRIACSPRRTRPSPVSSRRRAARPSTSSPSRSSSSPSSPSATRPSCPTGSSAAPTRSIPSASPACSRRAASAARSFRPRSCRR